MSDEFAIVLIMLGACFIIRMILSPAFFESTKNGAGRVQWSRLKQGKTVTLEPGKKVELVVVLSISDPDQKGHRLFRVRYKEDPDRIVTHRLADDGKIIKRNVFNE